MANVGLRRNDMVLCADMCTPSPSQNDGNKKNHARHVWLNDAFWRCVSHVLLGMMFDSFLTAPYVFFQLLPFFMIVSCRRNARCTFGLFALLYFVKYQCARTRDACV